MRATGALSTGLPDPPVLEGGGTRLRPWRDSDVSALAEACGDEAICRFTTVPRSYDAGAAQAWISRQAQRLREGSAVVFVIQGGADPSPAGTIWVFDLDHPTLPPRIGCWVIERRRGEGLATAGVRLMSRWIFSQLGFDAARLEIEPWNIASRSVARRVNCNLEARVDRQVAGTSVAFERYVLTPDHGRAR